ncbi:MAG: NAD(+) synthase [Saccharofermentanales bacterium]
MNDNMKIASNYGFVRTACASPKLKVANPIYNTEEIYGQILKAYSDRVQIIVFPEMCITGYTCQDLFFQKTLQQQALDSLSWLLNETKEIPVVIIAGLPLSINDRLYNCAAVLYRGGIYGVVPKSYLPNTKEFYEKRWFSVRDDILSNQIDILGQSVPFGNILFDMKSIGVTLGVEICEDLWAPDPPSTSMVLEGANVIVNLSASNELVSKAPYRRALVEQQSARCICAYLYSSAGVHESTTDLVFSGDCMIAENGMILAQSKRFQRESMYIISDIDTDKLSFERQSNSSFADASTRHDSCVDYDRVTIPFDASLLDFSSAFYRQIPARPFVPGSQAVREERCEEIFQIQMAGLAKRLEHTNIKSVFVGVSGGLDSTLALLICQKTFELLGMPLNNIVGVTMPGFGTTGQTYDNAVTLMKNLGITIKEIDIKASCLDHFREIGHDPEILDITYENVQARERTQILMDLANKHQGLVIGTGDMSELALGWCTYNGDHMSMYGVNSSIPKTLIKYLIEWISQTKENRQVSDVLKRILDTPISPELLPPDKDGMISQKTELSIGPYELHDFFLYHFLRQGAGPDKMVFLADKALNGSYDVDTIKKWLKIFYKRFFTQQFKRSCMPDGPKVGSVSLSPRGDWRMPSDADGTVWFDQMDSL